MYDSTMWFHEAGAGLTTRVMVTQISRCCDAGMVASQTTIKSQISGPSEALSINTVLCVLRLRPASAGLA